MLLLDDHRSRLGRRQLCAFLCVLLVIVTFMVAFKGACRSVEKLALTLYFHAYPILRGQKAR